MSESKSVDYWVGVHDGKIKMQARIIKLLKEHTIYYDDFGFDCCHLCGQLEISIENHLVALIKGETNV